MKTNKFIMKLKKRISFFSFVKITGGVILLLFALIICAKNAFSDSGASFLKIPVGARASGMGNAYTAVANDVTSLFWNPAGLALMKKKEISAMHTELFADTRYDFIGYAQPLKNASFGVGAVYLSQGKLEGRAEDRSKTTNFTASDLSVTLGLAGSSENMPFLESRLPFTIGTNFKILQSKIEGFSSTGFAFDFGLNYDSPFELVNIPVDLGFTVRNIGPKTKFVNESFHLPLTLAAGAAFEISKTHFPLTLSAEVKNLPYDSRTIFSMGGEFTPVSIISLRAGYLTNAIKATGTDRTNFNDKVSDLSGIGFGIGLKVGSGILDYSITPAGELGNSQRISLSLRFK